LTGTELRRRFWHMAPGVLPFLLWPIPHRDPLSPLLYSIIIAIAVAIAIAIFVRYQHIQRTAADHERLSAVAGYFFSVMAALLAYPGSPEIAFALLGILAFGDGSATFGGLLFGGPKLPWNQRKSWSGLLCFLAVGSVVSTLAYWGESHNLRAQSPGVDLLTAFLIGGVATFAAAIAESIPSRLNDNVRVGTTAFITVTLLHFALLGWTP
jgi:dolichol kinase